MADGSKRVEENELMLELSIGGIFGEPKRNGGETDDRIMNRSKAIQRRELRRKREPVVKQNDDVLEIEPVWKKERIGNIGSGLSDSVLGDGEVVVMNVNKKNCVLLPAACRSFRAYHMNVNPDEWEADGRICKGNSNGGASSVYSDAQCSSHQGVVATDDSRSNSSNSQLDQQLASTSAASADPYDQPTTNSTVSDPSPVNPPETSTQHKEASVLARMPSVSTTGNGPNGRTVSGFLYRYTKNEVSIVCVCHGKSFTPAGFVEHAGGVDITHPLKHITIFPTAFAS